MGDKNYFGEVGLNIQKIILSYSKDAETHIGQVDVQAEDDGRVHNTAQGRGCVHSHGQDAQTYGRAVQ
jgi:hypothetical protein